jgi:hypothetical protein
MLARAFAVVAAALLALTAACVEEATTSFGDLLAQYRCPVVDRLEQIYNGAPHSHPQNLFLIVYFAARPHDYVQCVFDPLTWMFCEAASGFSDNVASEPRTRHLPASAIAALGRLGFSTDDSAGNSDRVRGEGAAGFQRHRRPHSASAARRLRRPGGRDAADRGAAGAATDR